MTDTNTQQLSELLENDQYLNIPELGALITATVISIKGREVRLDVNGITTGVVRGRELFSEGDAFSGLKKGDKVEATVIDLENENGEMELSFRFAGNKKSWEDLKEQFQKNEVVEVKVTDANKGGLIVKLNHITGFLPVSQLAPENYPRVSGGDKVKILEKLKDFIGNKVRVHILDLNTEEEKLIVSEKTIWEDEQKNVISKIAIGDIIEGDITALADFGAFVKFLPKGVTDPAGALEGLVHISEIAWQRIDHPKDLLKTGQTVKAEIIGIDGSKIFLSMKKLKSDPWVDVENKYKIGDIVEGTVLKSNPFGLFVELDQDIHGLAHVSELSDEQIDHPSKVAKSGEVMKFKIVSIEPKEHRLGLSLKAISEKKKEVVEEVKKVEEVIDDTKKTTPSVEVENKETTEVTE
ncbi:MAG: RNA binding S1 protein [uncultured bacterium]|uniref:RNA binding S1 domain protein n=1 Tax=Candidatus Uhrbacteria bacterium GW2011_GWC1_41_20 TaxID=1618983 RepID=A0A0G0XSL9_9BACT|nr:MAG: RNA binding S1 protein [uncultured bacterium]KKR23220.1 MAG: RNA binding S1 domain protein [Candidatus Uhrbacteria bacterium GW2011_GWE1_39_46]KKR64402.1 MAG: RNA binding S1 domain protein [Candidatus Uhrbacteria bacterium GW2011_GWC2_40_450]KKR90719.1 MAG: RNA binding S1 domain protein [Candidatus Uhrbacteria bacterium GW2011_GWD2_41_121]KKR96564.1 MAG: RNA binding S1 domain protein [Candidatus Uhrbacteria bacterium GW2011_GWD1_41_16]KKR99955.1 MAG: RNA binding S1 domain protein [Cand